MLYNTKMNFNSEMLIENVSVDKVLREKHVLKKRKRKETDPDKTNECYGTEKITSYTLQFKRFFKRGGKYL